MASFPGALEMMILQSLRARPMHGYALTKHIKSSSDDLLQIEEGSLYPALQRMLKEGLGSSLNRASRRKTVPCGSTNSLNPEHAI